MVKKSGRRDSLGLLAAVEIHKHFTGGASHTIAALASVNVMSTREEIGSKSRVVKKGLQDDRLVAGLPHVPDTTGASTGTGILGSVVLDIRVRSCIGHP